MEAVMVLAAVPLLILNMLGGLVGGIGLAVQGHWSLLIGGIVWCVVGGFVLSIALLPGMIFAPLARWASNRGNTVAAVVACIPSLLWTYIVVTVTGIAVFYNVVARPGSGFFHLLWGYSVTTAPWSFLANKDKQSGNDASTMLMFFVQLGVVAMMVASWSDPESMTVADLLPWFVPFMVLGLVAQVFVAVVEGRNARYRGY